MKLLTPLKRIFDDRPVQRVKANTIAEQYGRSTKIVYSAIGRARNETISPFLPRFIRAASYDWRFERHLKGLPGRYVHYNHQDTKTPRYEGILEEKASQRIAYCVSTQYAIRNRSPWASLFFE